jgi:hypothetical protein
VKPNRATRITIESERVVIVTGDQSAQGRCEQCGREGNFSGPAQAGRVLEAISAQLGGTVSAQVCLQPAKNGLAIRLKAMLRSLKAAGRR